MSHKKRKTAPAPAAATPDLPKRGSPVGIVLFGLCLLAIGLYLGGWFNLVRPEQMTQCQTQVRQLYPKSEDQNELLPLCSDRHMIEGMSRTSTENLLSVQQIHDSLSVGKRMDIAAMFIGGAFIGASIAAFAAAQRAAKRRRGEADESE